MYSVYGWAPPLEGVRCSVRRELYLSRGRFLSRPCFSVLSALFAEQKVPTTETGEESSIYKGEKKKKEEETLDFKANSFFLLFSISR